MGSMGKKMEKSIKVNVEIFITTTRFFVVDHNYN